MGNFPNSNRNSINWYRTVYVRRYLRSVRTRGHNSHWRYYCCCFGLVIVVKFTVGELKLFSIVPFRV